MSSILKIKEHSLSVLSFSISVLIHIVIFFIAVFLVDLTFDSISLPPGYVQIVTTQKEKRAEDEIKSDDESEEKAEEIPEEKIQEKPAEKDVSEGNVFDAIFESVDTTNLNQLYRESTLDVELKYPAGWTFIDQNVKNKLDGVTFWSVKGNHSPPPYIHLEVKEKYLFNPSRFKYMEKMRSFIIYFNDPEELEGQVSQVLYIRTETDEDYSFKLIMKGRESFKSFQPTFYGMVKTFKFNNSFF